MAQLLGRKNRSRDNRNVVVEHRFPRLRKKPQVDGRCFMTPEPSNVYFGSNRVLSEPEEYKLVVVNGRIEKLSVNGKEHQAAMRVHDRVTTLARTNEGCRFELAELLHEMNTEHHYRLVGPGYSNLAEYIEKEQPITTRTVNGLLHCWEYYGLKYADCPRMLQGAKIVGWTKADSLIGVVTPDNMDAWFSFCENSTVKELATALEEHRRTNPAKHLEVVEQSSEDRLTRPARSRYGRQVGTVIRRVSEDEAEKEDVQGEGFSLADILGEDPFAEEKEQLAQLEVEARPTPQLPESTEAMLRRAKEMHGDWTSMVFDVPTEDRLLVSQAIKAAQEHGRTKNRGVALVHVCTHFASEFTTDYREYIEDWLSVIERVTGLKIAAVDTEKRQIVYGEEFLQREAKAS